MASQPARSLRRSKAPVKGEQKMKLSDAMKTKQASVEAENGMKNHTEAPTRKRLRGNTNAELPTDPVKTRKIEETVDQAPVAPKILAPKTPARQTLKTYSNRRSRSASAKPETRKEDVQKPPTVSQSKVANGIKHELERLGATSVEAGAKDEKRKLRSEGRARFKSELSSYFPEYDVVMRNEEQGRNLLDADTPILVVDSAPSLPKPRGRHSVSPTKRARVQKAVTNGTSTEPAFRKLAPDLFYNLNAAQKIDLSSFAGLNKNPKSDPLPDEYYKRPHLREERAEKGIKNLENMNSLHGRNHIAQLLEGLQGPDWLKVLGVGGVITEAKKSEFDDAKVYFIKRCVAYLKKCREWKEIEKRREAEKKRKAQEVEENEDSGDDSDGDPPDYSDVDSAAARQLHEEAVKRSAPHGARKRHQVGFASPPKLKPEKELTSFFAKPHLREAALTKRRRSGRGVLAFGRTIPDVPEQEFELPEEFKVVAARRSSPRRNTRTKRVSVLGSVVSRMTVPK